MNDIVQIKDLIYEIRGHRVMLDSDLADLYGVETKVLNKSVKRNISRFPQDFMFQLTKEEFNNLRFQNGTSNKEHGGRRYMFQLTEEEYSSLRSQIVTSKKGKDGRRYMPYVIVKNTKQINKKFIKQ